MSTPVESRAEPVRPPEPGLDLQRTRREHAAHRNARELVERRSVVRGLVVLALLALAFSLWRAGLDRAFVPGWWQQW